MYVCYPRGTERKQRFICRQEGQKAHPVKDGLLQVLNGVRDCHHNSLIPFSEGIKVI